jgi:H/ACA ribonucleoprotein complex subunit 3
MTEALLRRCRGCGKYTLAAACPHCGGVAGSPHPARFSPQDRWGKYRRALFEAERASRA